MHSQASIFMHWTPNTCWSCSNAEHWSFFESYQQENEFSPNHTKIASCPILDRLPYPSILSHQTRYSKMIISWFNMNTGATCESENLEAFSTFKFYSTDSPIVPAHKNTTSESLFSLIHKKNNISHVWKIHQIQSISDFFLLTKQIAVFNNSKHLSH